MATWTPTVPVGSQDPNLPITPEMTPEEGTDLYPTPAPIQEPGEEPTSEEPTPELSFGQKAVGITFNPSWDEKVHFAKYLSAGLIDLLGLPPPPPTVDSPRDSWIKNVFRTAAFNAVIAAQMAVVKFLTWKD